MLEQIVSPFFGVLIKYTLTIYKRQHLFLDIYFILSLYISLYKYVRFFEKKDNTN